MNLNKKFIGKRIKVLEFDNSQSIKTKLGSLAIALSMGMLLTGCNEITNFTNHNETSKIESPMEPTMPVDSDILEELERIEQEEQKQAIVSRTNVVDDLISNDCNYANFSINGYQPSEELINKINYLNNNYYKDSGFYLVSLDGAISMGYNIDSSFAAASAVKGPYALYCYKEIDNGNGSLDELKTYESRFYVEGSGVIMNSKFGTNYSLEKILFETINCSDNIGYYMLQDRFPTSGYDAMLESFGCESMQLKGSQWGKINPREMLKIWNHIYEYKEQSELGSKFFDTLLNAKFNFIKNAIPDYEVAHKSGFNPHGRHDAGIVFGPTPYLITVMTDGNGSSDDINYMKNIVQTLDKVMVEYNNYKLNSESSLTKKLNN